MASNSVGEDVLAAFRSGAESAFDQVFRTYFGPLSFYAFKIVKDERLAEDIVQDCFVELWQRRERLTSIQSLNSYLYRCVYNHCMTQLKKVQAKELLEEHSSESIETHIIQAEVLAKIAKALDNLPLRMQQVLRMYYLEEKSLDEIGKAIGIDPETARSHRYRGLQLLRKTIIPG